MINITRGQFIALRPCYPEDRLALWGDAESLNVEQALTRGYTVSDILWVAGGIGLKHQCVIFAVRCARLLGHIDPDPRVRAARAAYGDAARVAIDAIDAIDAADAARGAYATARAADVAAAAADAARAADAAYAAAYATYAAARTAYVNNANIRAILIDVFSQQIVD